jgi:hypothetical protein
MAKEERKQKGQTPGRPVLVMPPGENLVRDAEQPSSGSSAEHEYHNMEDVEDNIPMSPAGDQKDGDGVDGEDVDGDEMVAIYVGNGAHQDIFNLTQISIFKCPLLRDNLRKGDPPFVMHPILHTMTPAQFAPVQAFLSDWDYDPKLVGVGEATTEGGGREEEVLGDQLDVGLKYRLENIYLTAKAFGLSQMKQKTLQKLQVAWNFYAGVPQLPPFLNMIRFVMEQTNDDDDAIGKGTNCEAMHMWAVAHLVDLIMVYMQTHPEQIAGFLRDFPAMQVAVLSKRASNVASDQQKYPRLEDRFMKRESIFVAKEPESMNIESD